MNVRPLIIRELRAEARRPGNYWMRALAAGLLTGLFGWSVWNFAGHPSSLGPFLFQALSVGLLIGVLLIVAALTADSISREKREGTLGLLFLTPLGSRDIVVGKTLLHLLRALSIFLAMLPIIGLPFLLGGIPIDRVVFFFFALGNVLMVAVAGGMIASVRSTEWIQSMVLALLISVGFLSVGGLTLEIIGRVLQRHSDWMVMIFWASVTTTFLIVALWYSGRKLAETWQMEASEGGEPFWVRLFSTSGFWRRAFHWDTRKARDRNPIAWLQEYNWASRLTKWGWCILLFAAEMRMLLQFRRYVDYQLQLYVLTALGIAFSAAASFRRERQSGALELLLVTPVSAQQLIWGRLQGVWFHFFPAMMILTCVWCMGPQWISLPVRYMYYLIGAYFCIPIIGFYCSLLTSNILIGWLLTLFFGLLLPYGMTQAFYFDIGRRNIPFAVFAIQAAVAGIAGYLLYDNLKKRKFALVR